MIKNDKSIILRQWGLLYLNIYRVRWGEAKAIYCGYDLSGKFYYHIDRA